MKTVALIIGWLILFILGLAFFTTLIIIAYAAIGELADRIKKRFKK